LLTDGALKGPYSKIEAFFYIGKQAENLYIVSEKNERNVYLGNRRLKVDIPQAMAYHFSDDGKKLAYVRNENGEIWRRILTLE
jgi:hypothetical protein